MKNSARTFLAGLLLTLCLSNLPECASDERQNKQVLICENAVAFLTLSEEDVNLFLFKHKEREQEAIEVLSDFYSYAEKMEQMLKKAGISVKYSEPKNTYFCYPDGALEPVIFKEGTFYGMAMFAKGKKPKVMTNFGAHIEPMIEILSEYFKIQFKEKGENERFGNRE
ncbi:MAG TPA: hypothetical protein P5119_03585 [Candidatus Aminicenantes bacterium]|nr:hypothetical protein [Candidatus Aminicenantes bacterium]HRY64405.1 hypothetical protein [Candidatus Aminicenantes bacterium]HRZ71318.1 hypothetical protein [Candidatus Aminicenantes bacterium]